MKTPATFLVTVALLLSMQTIAGAVCLEVDVNVFHELLAGSDVLKRGADDHARFAAENPNNATMATVATNSRLACSEGYGYSYPASLFVNMEEDGSIERYRVEYIEPSVDIGDPSFTPQNPPIKYTDHITIIRTPENRYLARRAIQSGEVFEEIHPSYQLHTVDAEMWFRPYELYLDLLGSDRTPNLITSSFRRYEVDQPFRGFIEMSTDNREVRLYAGDVNEAKEYLQMTMESSDHRHRFPTKVSCWIKGQMRTTLYMTIKRTVNADEVDGLLTIPEPGEELQKRLEQRRREKESRSAPPAPGEGQNEWR